MIGRQPGVGQLRSTRLSNERVLKGGKANHGEVLYNECDPGSPGKK